MFTGMRYEEYLRFLDKQQWFYLERSAIHLPREASLKQKRTQPERYVQLSNYALLITERLFDQELPRLTRQGWRKALLKAAEMADISTDGITPKMTRKTWESWLVCCYPALTMQIALSQGHTNITAMNHYLNLSFSPSEKEDMKKYVNGFGGVSI
ncbi:site-specific integrase [Methanogenium organophilum]|uniref:Tyr recombinase domain-containing protein n=1 Tax=Methanogenium organophilum TaxID=2199 RepID=A0A9X9T8E1_METOG|nr:hypothetical protein [Methanogenium organophilum]WAI01346.1 hypothetical protein OU421_00265 [Methanogenium organophilum]